MLALIRKELREVLPVAGGFLAFAAIITGILYLHHWWSNGVGLLYTLTMSLFVLYMGCEALAGDGTRGLVEWTARWPVSRLQWWLMKFVTRWVVTSVVTVPVYLAVVWLSTHHGPQSGAHSGWGGAWWTLVTVASLGIVTPFFASSITRTSLHAFGLSILLGYVGGIAHAIPAALYMLLHHREFQPPPPYLTVVPALCTTVALLAGSLYAFLTVPTLDVARRAKRGLVTAALLIVPMLVLLLAAEVIGAAVRKPTPQGIQEAALSPDGRQIAFSDDFATEGLWLVNTDGTGLRRVLKQQATEFHWLPGASQLLVANHIEVVQRGPGGRTSRSWNSDTGEIQWSVLDAQAPKPALQPVFKAKEGLHISPRGKYLLAGGQIIEVGSWRAVGEVTKPRYEPWLLTWLPDDSAIYVREYGYRGQPQRVPGPGNGPAVTVGGRPYELLKRIAVPSGQVTVAKLPWRPPGVRGDQGFIGANALSDSALWFSGDSSTWTPTPRSQQRVVTRTMDVMGRDGKRERKPVTYRTNTHKQSLKTTFFRVDGSRCFELPGVRPYHSSLSPTARYCLVNDGAGARPEQAAVPAKVAFLDLTTGRVGRWFTLPAMGWTDDVEGLLWSPDERWLALLMEKWPNHDQRDVTLIFLSPGGDMKTVPPGARLGGFGGDGLIGWTPAGEFIVLREEKELVALTPAGQERVIVQAHGWRVDHTDSNTNDRQPPSQRGE